MTRDEECMIEARGYSGHANSILILDWRQEDRIREAHEALTKAVERLDEAQAIRASQVAYNDPGKAGLT